MLTIRNENSAVRYYDCVYYTQFTVDNYSVAVAIPDATANIVACRAQARQFVESFVICIYRIPDSILTDQGTNFMSGVFIKVCKILDIKILHTTAYHPQSNGTLERSYSTLKNYYQLLPLYIHIQISLLTIQYLEKNLVYLYRFQKKSNPCIITMIIHAS